MSFRHLIYSFLPLGSLCALPVAALAQQQPPGAPQIASSGTMTVNTRAEARARLLATIAEYAPGTRVAPELDARVRAAADQLEATAAGPPDIKANPALVDGMWICLFDSRDLLHEAGMRIMSGGLYPEARIPALSTIQVLTPAKNYYRNVVLLAAGPQRIPVIYDATAQLGFDDQATNVFRVKFERLAFLPADARHGEADVRRALGLPDGAALVIDVPPGPASPSTVTYLDEELRINRGKGYIAVMRRLGAAQAPPRP
jgi:hypothetical protein